MWVASYLQHIGWRAGFADGGSYGDFYHSNPTVNCADRAVVRLQQVGAVILYCLERPGSDATRADKANGRLIPSYCVADSRGDSDLDYQKTEEETLTCEVSDDALEAASGTPCRGVPTLFHNTYCFGCPA